MACILLIDDSAFARRVTLQSLKSHGDEVLEASNGIEGVELAEQKNPDCIVLDLLMPEMSGFEVIKALNEKGLSIPVVVLSADVQESTRAECLELGAVAFVNKPPKEAELVEVIHGILCSN